MKALDLTAEKIPTEFSAWRRYFLLLPSVIMLSHSPVDGVVFKFESSEQVHDVICVRVG